MSGSFYCPHCGAMQSKRTSMYAGVLDSIRHQTRCTKCGVGISSDGIISGAYDQYEFNSKGLEKLANFGGVVGGLLVGVVLVLAIKGVPDLDQELGKLVVPWLLPALAILVVAASCVGLAIHWIVRSVDIGRGRRQRAAAASIEAPTRPERTPEEKARDAKIAPYVEQLVKLGRSAATKRGTPDAGAIPRIATEIVKVGETIMKDGGTGLADTVLSRVGTSASSEVVREVTLAWKGVDGLEGWSA